MNLQRIPSVPRHTLLLNFLLFFLVIATIAAAASAFVTYQRFRLQQEVMQHAAALRLQLAGKIVSRNLQQAIIDSRLLSHSQYLQEYLRDPSPANITRLQTEFINLSQQTGLYDQIRFIDRRGRERIRINYNRGRPQAVSQQQLQDKSSRYYFRESIVLPAGQIYLSQMDLNMEHGKIEQPIKPMIRFAIPLFDPVTKHTVGILVLNYLAAHTLTRYNEVMAEGHDTAMILNRDGYWLYSNGDDDVWGFMYGRHETFARRYPQAWAAMHKSESGFIRTSRGLFCFTTVRPDVIAGIPNAGTKPNALTWRLVTYVAPEKLAFPFWKGMREHAALTFWILIMLAMLSYLLAWQRTNNIEKTTALKANRARYRNLFENMEEGYILFQAIYDADGKAYDFRLLEVNPAFERILGLKREEVVDKTLLTVLPETEHYWLETYARVATTGKAAHLEQYGSSFGRYFEITAACPDYGLVAVFFSDITDRKHAEEQQRQATTAFNNTMEAIMITDAKHHVTAINKAFQKITGYTEDDVIGNIPRLHRSDRQDEAFFQDLWQTLAQEGHWQGEISHLRKDGQVYPAWENISVVRNNQGQVTNYVSVFSDISTIKATEAQLNELAHHDYLTGLDNRLAFNHNLEHALERARRHHHKVVLLFLDLDRFKLINDNLGHDTGDRMLQIVAARLKQNVRAEDMVARLGGDEFTVILEEIDHSQNAAALAQKLIRAISEPMHFNDQELVISTSIGLSIFPDDADSATDLAKAADTAMYRAKSHGRHTFEFYSSELTNHTIQRLSLENDLRQALAHKELQLYYQPQYEIASGKLCGVEALLRWQHPEHGLLLPADFIHIVAESQWIDDIGTWVLQQVYAQARDWRDAGLPQIRIAVNLAARQIMYDNLVDTIQQAMTENRLQPDEIQLELEIAETVLQSEELIVEQLENLHQLGASIAIDEFGAGHSSLMQLKQLPIDAVKIGHKFIQSIPQDNDNKAIANAIIAIGHKLGLRVIAKGVEKLTQLQFLKQHACDEAQGYFFGEALPPDHIEKLFKQGRFTLDLAEINLAKG